VIRPFEMRDGHSVLKLKVGSRPVVLVTHTTSHRLILSPGLVCPKITNTSALLILQILRVS